MPQPTQAPPAIILPERHDAGRVGAILGDAFANDPVLQWLLRDTSAADALFRILADKVYLPHGCSGVLEGNGGAALWLPPDQHSNDVDWPVLLRMLPVVIRAGGWSAFGRLQRLIELGAKHHIKIRHYYLFAIGVRQKDQGLGLGSLMLKHGTQRCDREGVSAYLESSNERNLPLYERHGFETFAEGRPVPDGPKIWFMARQPQT